MHLWYNTYSHTSRYHFIANFTSYLNAAGLSDSFSVSEIKYLGDGGGGCRWEAESDHLAQTQATVPLFRPLSI